MKILIWDWNDWDFKSLILIEHRLRDLDAFCKLLLTLEHGGDVQSLEMDFTSTYPVSIVHYNVLTGTNGSKEKAGSHGRVWRSLDATIAVPFCSEVVE